MILAGLLAAVGLLSAPAAFAQDGPLPNAPFPSRVDPSRVNPAARDARYAQAGERILRYESDIVVGADGELDITETITVNAEGNEIRRGIFRDFPTVYSGRGVLGTALVVPFEVVAVARDGRPEPYHTEPFSDGVRVYVGDANVFVEHGRHTYTLRYRTARQLGFFDEHDELYWNVTGNFWAFPIDDVVARVRLPAAVDLTKVSTEGYVGAIGSKEQASVRSGVDTSRGGELVFAAARPLARAEGLTLVARFPKGAVMPPGALSRIFTDSVAPIGAAGVLIVLLYFVVAWFLVGRDPARGTVIPLYEPPPGMEPAAVGYVREMQASGRTLTSTITDLAVRGALVIEEHAGKYAIERRPGWEQVARGPVAEAVATALLAGRARLEVSDAHHEVFSGARTGAEKALEAEHHNKTVFPNTGVFMVGALLALGTLGVAVLSKGANWGGAALAALAGLAVAMAVSPGSQGALLRGVSFAVAAAAVVGFSFLPATMAPASLLPTAVLLFVLVFLFADWIERRSPAGHKLAEAIEGFRLYLSVAEKDRLSDVFRIANPQTLAVERGEAPPRTIELFERYLPYAIALDVEQEWGEKFADVIAAASAAGNGDGDGDGGYQRSWYRGDRALSAAAFGAGSMGFGASMTHAVSSASTAPGSSGGGSGGGGGGSSGGGGGGGGGGGW